MTTTLTDLTLGKLNSGSFGGQLDIAEILIYNVEPTAAELQQTMQYANNYWDVF